MRVIASATTAAYVASGAPGVPGAPARPRKESLADVLRRRSNAGAVELHERTAAVQHSLAALMAGGQAPGGQAPGGGTGALSGSLADESVAHLLRRLAGRRKSGRLG